MYTDLDHSFQVCDISVPLNPRNPLHIHEIYGLNMETRVEIEEIYCTAHTAIIQSTLNIEIYHSNADTEFET